MYGIALYLPDLANDDAVAQFHRTQRGQRLALSCRLPGGMVVTIHIASKRKVRHLKAAVTRNQSRFTTEAAFELFLSSGKHLASLEAALEDCGVHDGATLQVVPAPNGKRSRQRP